MRISEIFNEAITTKPQNLKYFFEIRSKLLSKLIYQTQQALTVIKRLEREDDYVLRYALGQVLGERPMIPGTYQVDIVKRYNLENIKDSIDSILKFGVGNFLKYLLDNFQYIQPIDDETKTILDAMPQVESGFSEYGFRGRDEEDDQDYKNAREMADAFDQISDVLKQLNPLLLKLKTVSMDLQKRDAHNYRPEDYRPDHEEVETLFHASIYATEIAENGFSSEKPTEREGLGNYGDQKGISFTHDYKVAHDIMRYLKELWMIVHGQVKRSDILSWMKAENIDPKKAASLFTTRDSPNSLENIVRLYRGYIGFSKIRTDPVFVSPERLIPVLKNRKLNDIGIVSCSVRLDGKEEYKQGESEFRVMASQIVGPIKRVI